MHWSKNYKNLFNKEIGFMNARLFNGDWAKNTQEGFTEGGAMDLFVRCHARYSRYY